MIIISVFVILWIKNEKIFTYSNLFKLSRAKKKKEFRKRNPRKMVKNTCYRDFNHFSSEKKSG